MNIVQRM
jgi:hypothetical protein